MRSSRTRCPRERTATTSSAASVAVTWRRSGRYLRAPRRWRRGIRTSGSTTPTTLRRRPATPVAAWRRSRSTSWTRDGWRSCRIPRAPRSASGRRWTTRAHTVVNEHGSLNFNGLATRDPGAAEAFYGAVFLVGGRWRCPPVHVGTAGLRRSPRGEDPRPARADRFDGRSRGLHRRRRRPPADRRRRHADAGALERHVRDRRRRGDCGEGDRARRRDRRRPARRRRGPSWRSSRTRRGRTFIASQFVPENQALEA